MGSILDILQGNPGAASLWNVLYPSTINGGGIPVAPGQAPDVSNAAAYGALGVDPSAIPMPTPPVSPFPQQPQQQPPAPAPSFGGGAAPFSFAGPGSNMVAPSQIAPPVAPAPQPAPAPAPQADQAGPIGVGNYQMPRVGAADDFEPDDSTPANAAPTQGRMPAGPPAPAPFSLGGAASGVGDRLGLAGKGFLGNMASGPIGALAGGLGALISGKPTDASSIAQQGGNLTAQALIAKGASPADVVAASKNPPLMAALIQQYYGKEKFTPVETTDMMGRKSVTGAFNASDGSVKPVNGGAPAAGGAGDEGLGDMSKTGAAYIASVPTAYRGTLQGMLDGTLQPPSSFAASKPYWQAMIAAAKHADSTFDENNWAARHKMSIDLASSGNSTMGGILSNGESSFKHLAEYTASAADQGNASHDFPFGGAIAHAQNYIGNSAGGSTTFGKVKAINDNLGHYGQESTKFYAGTGGGVEERMNALKEMNPVTTSSEEAAAYATKEKGLMLDRLNTKFQEIRNTYGDADAARIIAKHMPDIQANIAKIDANIAKLRGQPAPVGGADGAAVPPPGNYVWTPGGGLSGGK